MNAPRPALDDRPGPPERSALMHPPLRILQVHDEYALRGGEEESVESEIRVLSARGHRLTRWTKSNAVIDAWPMSRKLRLFWATTWSRESCTEMKELIARHTPDIVQFHNIVPLISPSAIRATHDAGVPVVMTLHNYRLICPAATLLRRGRICEECPTHTLLRSVVHGCYRESRVQTAALAGMLAAHRRAGTWRRCVDAYIALTPGMRARIAAAGIPPGKIHVNSNFVEAEGAAPVERGDHVLFVGRLSPEKGIATLIEALPSLPGVGFRIVGAGPLEPLLDSRAGNGGADLRLLGRLSRGETMREMSRARALVFPSTCYEGLPRVIIESLACGLPVIASRLGAMEEIITDGENGLLFAPGSAADLARCIRRVLSDAGLRKRLGDGARRTFEERYSIDRTYERLMDIYRAAIESARARRAAA